MSSFVPLNLTEDPTVSKEDLEEEHSRELQVEQAFKIYQEALGLQKSGSLVEAYKRYDELFKLEILSNHYHEEEDFVRGLQKGSQNTITDELTYLSPNIKTLRFLVFRNRGFLYLNILKAEANQPEKEILAQLMKVDNAKKEEVKIHTVSEKYRDLFYTLIDDFCICLFYQEGDEKLLEHLYEIFMYLRVFRLAKFTLEYSLSGAVESDDLMGLLPLNGSIKKSYNLLNGLLSVRQMSQNETEVLKAKLEKLDLKYSYLEPIKAEFRRQVESTNSKRRVEIRIKADDVSLSWSNIISSVNNELKTIQDDEKLEDIGKMKLKYVEPYLLTEDPIEQVKFNVGEIDNISDNDDDEMFEDAKDEINKEHDVEDVVMEEVPAEIEEETSKDTKEEKEESPETTKLMRIAQRSSKRLARSDTDTPEIDLKQDYFYELRLFIESLNKYLANASPDFTIGNMIQVYFDPTAAAPVYVRDFVDIVNDWNAKTHTKVLVSGQNSTEGKSTDDERLKLIEVLNNFGSKLSADTSEGIPKLEYIETKTSVRDFLLELNEKQLHYEDVKSSILRRLLGIIEVDSGSELVCLVADTKWPHSLCNQVKEWVYQFDTFLLENMRISQPKSLSESVNNVVIALGIQEILVDTYISLKSQISSAFSQLPKKWGKTKSQINNSSFELMKIKDKLSRWKAYSQSTWYELRKRRQEAGTNAPENNIEGLDKLLFNVECRACWCDISLEQAQNFNWADSDIIMAKINELLEYIGASEFVLDVALPNYENLTSINVKVIKSQLTTTSVMSMFSRIIYSESTENNDEAIALLEGILIDNSQADIDEEALQSIKAFLNNSPVDLKLSLWNVLFIYYLGSKKIESFQYGLERVLEFIETFLTHSEYSKLEPAMRQSTLLSILGFYGDILNTYLDSLSTIGWKLPSSGPSVATTLQKLVRFVELFFVYCINEEAAYMSSTKVSIQSRSSSAGDTLKNIFVSTICVMVIYYNAAMGIENAERTIKMEHEDQTTKVNGSNVIKGENESESSHDSLPGLISVLHYNMGTRKLCSYSSGRFLRMAQEMLGAFQACAFIEKELVQIISCRFHYKINTDSFTPEDHMTAVKQPLDFDTTVELSRFVLPLCFKKNPLVSIPKHDTKALIDDLYEVVGDPNFEESDVLSRNDSMFEYFFEATKLTPRLMKDAFHGLLRLDLDPLETSSATPSKTQQLNEIVQNGLYYLEGLLVFTSYKVRKKNMQSRAVELEQIIMLLKNDLIHCTNRIESWYLLGQAYGFLVEDDLIWTSDKLTVADRKVGTANLQRKSLLCYLMAINGTLSVPDTSKDLIKPIIGNLMSSFAKEMYSACMEPMGMHAFKVQSQPRFIRKPSGAAFLNVSTSCISLQLCLKLIQQSLHLAIKSKLREWTNYYYLAKIQRKLGKEPREVLDTLLEAAYLAKDSVMSGDHIIEPHYMMVSMIYKYYKSGQISFDEGVHFLNSIPGLDLQVFFHSHLKNDEMNGDKSPQVRQSGNASNEVEPVKESETTNVETENTKDKESTDPNEVDAGSTSLKSKTHSALDVANGSEFKSLKTSEANDVFFDFIVAALKKVDSFDKKNWHHKPRFRLAKILYDDFGKIEEALDQLSSFISLKATSKTLVSIWKPENERPGKHFFYTFQYSKFYIQLLTEKNDLISLVSMLPKLRRSNSTMIDLYTAWEILCSSICKIIRSSLDIGSNVSFTFFETFMNSLSYQTFMLNSKAIIEDLQTKGIPKDLEAHLGFLYAVNDMKKFNNGFGPTSLIDDTIVGIFLKIYLYFNKALEHPTQINQTDSPGGKIKKIAKRDIFPFATDLLKHFKKEIEKILAEKPKLYNEYVRSVIEEKQQKEQEQLQTPNPIEVIAEETEADANGQKDPSQTVTNSETVEADKNGSNALENGETANQKQCSQGDDSANEAVTTQGTGEGQETKQDMNTEAISKDDQNDVEMTEAVGVQDSGSTATSSFTEAKEVAIYSTTAKKTTESSNETIEKTQSATRENQEIRVDVTEDNQDKKEEMVIDLDAEESGDNEDAPKNGVSHEDITKENVVSNKNENALAAPEKVSKKRGSTKETVPKKRLRSESSAGTES